MSEYCDACGVLALELERHTDGGLTHWVHPACWLKYWTKVSEPVADVAADLINSPPHYLAGPACEHCGKTIECVVVAEHFGFRVGNAIKYLFRAGLKGGALEDLKKAAWYIAREIARIEAGK